MVFLKAYRIVFYIGLALAPGIAFISEQWLVFPAIVYTIWGLFFLLMEIVFAKRKGKNLGIREVGMLLSVGMLIFITIKLLLK